MTEVTIHRAALDKDPATVAGWYADFVATACAGTQTGHRAHDG